MSQEEVIQIMKHGMNILTVELVFTCAILSVTCEYKLGPALHLTPEKRESSSKIELHKDGLYLHLTGSKKDNFDDKYSDSSVNYSNGVDLKLTDDGVIIPGSKQFTTYRSQLKPADISNLNNVLNKNSQALENGVANPLNNNNGIAGVLNPLNPVNTNPLNPVNTNPLNPANTHPQALLASKTQPNAGVNQVLGINSIQSPVDSLQNPLLENSGAGKVEKEKILDAKSEEIARIEKNLKDNLEALNKLKHDNQLEKEKLNEQGNSNKSSSSAVEVDTQGEHPPENENKLLNKEEKQNTETEKEDGKTGDPVEALQKENSDGLAPTTEAVKVEAVKNTEAKEDSPTTTNMPQNTTLPITTTEVKTTTTPKTTTVSKTTTQKTTTPSPTTTLPSTKTSTAPITSKAKTTPQPTTLASITPAPTTPQHTPPKSTEAENKTSSEIMPATEEPKIEDLSTHKDDKKKKQIKILILDADAEIPEGLKHAKKPEVHILDSADLHIPNQPLLPPILPPQPPVPVQRPMNPCKLPDISQHVYDSSPPKHVYGCLPQQMLSRLPRPKIVHRYIHHYKEDNGDNGCCLGDQRQRMNEVSEASSEDTPYPSNFVPQEEQLMFPRHKHRHKSYKQRLRPEIHYHFHISKDNLKGVGSRNKMRDIQTTRDTPNTNEGQSYVDPLTQDFSDVDLLQGKQEAVSKASILNPIIGGLIPMLKSNEITGYRKSIDQSVIEDQTFGASDIRFPNVEGSISKVMNSFKRTLRRLNTNKKKEHSKDYKVHTSRKL